MYVYMFFICIFKMDFFEKPKSDSKSLFHLFRVQSL